MKTYAGIGSRQTPKPILALMTRCAELLADCGWFLRSGGAKGADAAFEAGCKDLREIFRADDAQTWAFDTVDRYHPAPQKLDNYARALMARNAMQILGRDGADPVRFVLCWTPNGSGSGGTGQAIRIANAHDIPVYDMGLAEVEARVRGWAQMTELPEVDGQAPCLCPHCGCRCCEGGV